MTTSNTKGKILVLGAGGQIGVELTAELRKLHGHDRVVASDVRKRKGLKDPFELVDVLNFNKLARVIDDHNITQVFLLAALLSATAEQKPKLGWKLNMEGLFNVLDLAIEKKLKVFWPSSIAAFGPTTPKKKTPQRTVMEPVTVYGISKQAGERWCEYYHLKYGVDVRSLRYPGLISYMAAPGGGTTDYAVNIFHAAVEKGTYESFLDEDSVLPMMYMPDAIRATLELMDAPPESVKVRNSYNIAAMSFSPRELAMSIQKHIPGFKLTCKPDYRQQIAAGWPESIDDSAARADWGWVPGYSLDEMAGDMISHIRKLKGKLTEPVK